MQHPPRVILQDKPSAAEIPVYWTIMGLGMAICFWIVAQTSSAIPLIRNGFLFFAISSVILAVLRILIDLIKRELSLYTLTDQCLTVRRGFHQKTNTIPIEHLQRIVIRKPMLGQFLNYGTPIVKAPGFSFVKIDRVPQPEQWQSAIPELRHVH